MEKLNQVFSVAAQDMYNAANEGGSTPNSDASTESSSSEDEVTDVDFEEVDDK